MKYTALTCLIVAALLIGVKILYERLEPPPRLIHDMTLPTEERATLPPPAGTVPLMSSPALPSAQKEAAELFALHCAACHDAKGTGQSYVAAQPGMPEVNDLTVSDVTLEELYRTLSDGRGAMPAHADRLSEEERRRLIHYITHTLRQP